MEAFRISDTCWCLLRQPENACGFGAAGNRASDLLDESDRLLHDLLIRRLMLRMEVLLESDVQVAAAFQGPTGDGRFEEVAAPDGDRPRQLRAFQQVEIG